MKLIVTRPLAQARDWVNELQAELQHSACEVVALPLIEIAPLADPAPVQAAWQGLASHALVMFVSANAVQQFFALAPPGTAWPAGTRAGCTGPGTAAALRAAGLADAQIVQPTAAAERFDSEALWQQLAHEDWAGRSVLVVRGEEGRDWLAETLRARGAQVQFVAAYQRRVPVLRAEEQALLAQALAQPAAHLWHFSSSEAVANLQALAPAAGWSGATALASHPRIAQAAQRCGFGRVQVVAPNAAAVARLARAWPEGNEGPPLQSSAS